MKSNMIVSCPGKPILASGVKGHFSKRIFPWLAALVAIQGASPLRPAHAHNPIIGMNGLSLDSLVLNGIFGEDDRKLFFEHFYPWGAIGILRDSAGRPGCIATLVGRNIALTALHCIVSEIKDGKVTGVAKVSSFQALFEPPLYAGESSKILKFIVPDPLPDMNIQLRTMDNFGRGDWALMILEEPLGDRCGFFPWKEFSPEDLGKKEVVSMGYPSDHGTESNPQIMTQEVGCAIREGLPKVSSKDKAGVLFDDCDVTPGNSGGPLLIRDPKTGWAVIGIHSSIATLDPQPVYSERNPNVAVSAKEFGPSIDRAMKEDAPNVPISAQNQRLFNSPRLSP